MRKFLITVPDDYCNECIFYSSGVPSPDTGASMGFRHYYCALFKQELQCDFKKIHKKGNDTFWDPTEHKAIICKECRTT